MLNTIKNVWAAVKAPFTWLNNLRHKVNDWVYRQIPGWKTHITASIMFLGNSAFYLKDYMGQVPVEFLQKYVTGDTILLANMVLLTFVFWFKSLSNRDQ